MGRILRGALALTVTLATGVLAGCYPSSYMAACTNRLRAANGGTVTDPALNEISGIETGVANPGILWVHNDSGHPNVIYALDQTGAVRGTYTLTGATSEDWEDIAVAAGPTPGSGTIYVGDIGDNTKAHGEVRVYRVAEPVVPLTGPPVTVTLPAVDVLHLKYPDGPHDAETLMYDPGTRDLAIVTKVLSGGPQTLFTVPADTAAGTTTVLTRVQDITLPAGVGNAVTSGDISADGSSVVLRTYGSVRYYPRLDGWTLAKAFTARACTRTVVGELQGEAVTFDDTPTGRGVATISEGPGQTIHLDRVP